MPDGPQPGLHVEPLDVAIRRLLALYRPGASAMVINGSNTTNTQKQKFSFTVHYAYTQLVKKRRKRDPLLKFLGVDSSRYVIT